MRSARLGVIGLLLAACSSTVSVPASPTALPAPGAEPEPWPAAPPIRNAALDPRVGEALDRLIEASGTGALDGGDLATVGASGDPRQAWILADILRFAPLGSLVEASLLDAFIELTGTDPRDDRFGAYPWQAITNLLIAWDLPAPPDYRDRKAAVFLRIEPRWAPFFADAESTIDWRIASWGGVFIDDRAVGDGRDCSRGCIPALDDPALTSAADGRWYGDDRVVFGVVVDDEAVALPKHMMEVHEMVNLTVGGRRLGIPYCTLCGSAQAYLVDAVPSGVETLVLRTSGLLSRSNKIMYDLVTDSAFNTFTGRATSGPLREIGLVLEPVSVTVSTWGAWKDAHPRTRIVARDGGIGRTYVDDPLCGRDDGGPIFPIGAPDSRLPAQAPVIGVLLAGSPIAFSADQAHDELAAGRGVAFGGVELVADGDGFRAISDDGTALVAHQAFWFAWSQFHPSTALWAPAVATDATPRSDGRATPGEGCWDVIDPTNR